jgi:hypothetical protein
METTKYESELNVYSSEQQPATKGKQWLPLVYIDSGYIWKKSDILSRGDDGLIYGSSRWPTSYFNPEGEVLWRVHRVATERHEESMYFGSLVAYKPKGHTFYSHKKRDSSHPWQYHLMASFDYPESRSNRAKVFQLTNEPVDHALSWWWANWLDIHAVGLLDVWYRTERSIINA